MRSIVKNINKKRIIIILIIVIIDIAISNFHSFFKNSSFVPRGSENADHPLEVYIFDLEMYVIYFSFSLVIFLLTPKKDLFFYLISLANLVFWGLELIDFLLFKNQGYINIKDYLVLLAFALAFIYGIRTYRRRKGDTEEIVNVTNIALLKMLLPKQEVKTVTNLIEEKEKVDNEYNNLLYHLQHQIKQPFTSLEGLMQLEESEMRQQMIYKCLHDVKTYLQELTNLDYVSNYYKLEPKQINYRKIFNTLKSNIPNITKVHVHYYESNVDDFKMDESLFTNILEKLLQNAVNFSKESTFQKPNVNVYIYKNSSSELVIEVKDEGIGIEPEQKERIFEMFYKGSLKSTGVGLGLYIVKKTVEKLKGKIYVESKLNSGSSFKVIIPEIKEAKSQEASAQSAA